MRSPLVPDPPDRIFCSGHYTVACGTPLHRAHSPRFRPGEFNPCLGNPSRFAPFADAVGACVPTLYAATSLKAAVFETIFHDVPAAARFKTVREGSVRSRHLSVLAPRRDLVLAPLFAPELKAWRLQRRQLIDTSKAQYGRTVRWAAALHRDCPGVDGLIWTSRQADPDLCVIMFGDRVGEAELDQVAVHDLSVDVVAYDEVLRLGRSAGVTVVA